MFPTFLAQEGFLAKREKCKNNQEKKGNARKWGTFPWPFLGSLAYPCFVPPVPAISLP